MRYLKELLLEDDMYDLEFDNVHSKAELEEEQEESNQEKSSSLKECLLKNVETSQELLNTYVDIKEAADLIKIAETTIETSQMMVNFLSRQYGPVEQVQQSIKSVLEQVYNDYQKYNNFDLAMNSAQSVKECINIM